MCQGAGSGTGPKRASQPLEKSLRYSQGRISIFVRKIVLQTNIKTVLTLNLCRLLANGAGWSLYVGLPLTGLLITNSTFQSHFFVGGIFRFSSAF